jgi:predicted metal-dependent enzyme (double-stranded beta helix superfamily)
MTFSIDQFTAECLDARREGDSATAVKDVLSRTIAEPAPISASLGTPSTLPSFETWFNNDELTILHVVWPPGVDLFPHDHKMWAAIGLYGGREDNALFRRLPGGRLEKRAEKVLLGGDTVLLGDDTVHAVANPSREWTAAIHIYGGNYFSDGRSMWPDATGTPEPFETSRLVGVLEAAADNARRGAD